MIIPVVLENKLEDIALRMKGIEKVAELVQIDFSDGSMADNTTFMDYSQLNSIDTNLKLEFHLMVKDPTEIFKYDVKNVIKICSQIEADVDINQFISNARNKGYEVGLSIDINSPNDLLIPYIDKVDYIQFMAVEMGRQGQPFQERVIPKIKSFTNKYSQIPVQVDGGLNKEHIRELHELGVKHFVVGSDIFNHRNPAEKYIELSSLSWTK